jgi:dihydroxyacetone kinase DhaKLM complex PTS-EIIA-like component DhaM
VRQDRGVSRPSASPFRDEDRPRAPEHPGAPLTPAGRGGQQALRGIHDHLRHEMAQVVRAVQAAVTDARRAADARALISDLTMGVNYRALGSFCGRYCQVVDLHHRIEDASMFVDLGQADPELQPVLERLSAEHVVVHEWLVELDAALVEMLAAEAAALPRVQAAVEALSAGLLDHLDYEERELLPALGRLGLPV